MTRGRWPYPGDGPLVRARRVALAYRSALSDAAPQRCAALDTVIGLWGEVWAVPRVLTYAPDDWLTASEAADVASVSTDTVGAWRRRGHLDGRRTGRRWEYQARDVMAMSATARQRADHGGGDETTD